VSGWVGWLLLALVVVVVVLGVLDDRRVARELARRPLREFQVAGLDREAVVGRHATWGSLPFVSRRDLRRLDRARARIEGWESGQDDAGR